MSLHNQVNHSRLIAIVFHFAREVVVTVVKSLLLYICLCLHSFENCHSFPAPPRIKKSESRKLTQVKVSQGESVTMRCDVTGYPAPWIFWTRDGKTVHNATKNGALTINQAQEQMTGIYTCVAQNKVGVDTYDVLLLVTSCKHQTSGVRYDLRGESNLLTLSLMHCNKAQELYLTKFARVQHLVISTGPLCATRAIYPIQPQVIVYSRRCCRLRQTNFLHRAPHELSDIFLSFNQSHTARGVVIAVPSSLSP